MMKRNWTDNQLDAITARDGSVIVSAAAGSGKTAVLVERCMRLLTDPVRQVDADRLLVVTFTRAAAAEMKDRLSRALGEMIRSTPDNAGLIRQQRLLQKAKICTVDSFCSSLVKEFFYLLDIDRGFRVADDGELSVIRADAMRMTLDAMYTEGSDAFHHIVETFASAKDDARLETNILKLYDFVCSHPFSQRWMREKLADYTDFTDVSTSVWGRIIRDYTADALDFLEKLYDRGHGAVCLDEVIYKAMGHLFESDRLFLDRLREAVEAEHWDRIKETLASFVSGSYRCPKGYGDNPLKNTAAAARNTLRKVVGELKAIYQQDEAMCLYDIEIVKGYTEQIFRAVQLFTENFAALKNARGIADYADLEHWVVNLLIDPDTLQKTPLAAEIGARFDYILVDEYQDANETQEYIYAALSRGEENLFVVGDVKQSIYGFRHAMPELFLRRKDRAALYNRERPVYPAKIILEKNFRSEKNVLYAINDIFRRLMSPSVGDIEYNEEEALCPGAPYEESAEAAMEFAVIDKESVGEDDALLAEARVIAERIHKMVNEGYPVKDGDGYRGAEYGDFAVLLRSFGSTAPTYVDVLSMSGIPVSTQSDSGFLSAREIMVMTNFLRAINNPALDIEMLSTVMSPVFGFTENDMARIRSGRRSGSLYAAIIADADRGSRRSRRFLDELAYYREASVTQLLSKLINIIYERSSYPDIMSAADRTGVARNNLRMLLDYARSFEQNTHRGLSAFIGYLDRLTESGCDLGAAQRDRGAGDGGVKVMSIHASKGLEFPVVFLANTYHQFVSDASNAVLLHPRYGYAQKRYDPVLSASFNTLPRMALSMEIARAEKSEELRVLYVALTRARQKLIILATPRTGAASYLDGISKKLAGEREISPYVVRTCARLADWIAMCAMLHPDGEPLRQYAGTEVDYEHEAEYRMVCCVVTEPFDRDDESVPELEADEAEIGSALDESPIIAELRKHAAFVYPYEGLNRLPVKVAASALAHRDSPIGEKRYLNRPAFLSDEKLNAAEKGTALHAFMQFADFAAARKGIRDELDRLTAGGYLTPQQGESIDVVRAADFINSALVTRCLSAESVYKEYRFNVKIPAAAVDPEAGERFKDERIILQGAVDLAFIEDGELVIVDYKTDRVKQPEELAGRYRRQLELYRGAMEECLGVKVKECIIYSVWHGAEIKV
jgi:ATP-dependent helicase/nuclease subunit A